MKKRTIAIYLFILLVAAGLAGLEIFYFKFHTYFQRTAVNEALPVQAEMEIVAEGQFIEIDMIHKGSGTAKIIEQNGKRYLRFENFSVTNGPDLYVYLTDSEKLNNNDESLGEYVNLGRLKGNVGSQNYEIPESAWGYRTAVVWCRQFSVLFSYAAMK
ncbi:MAG: DM13 domain-containing protein [Candidatus Nealsonbacteria bacterium]|nr:DM13 domain-containing protein [Candidatus Nealsonbacteria bacterium]